MHLSVEMATADHWYGSLKVSPDSWSGSHNPLVGFSQGFEQFVVTDYQDEISGEGNSTPLVRFSQRFTEFVGEFI